MTARPAAGTYPVLIGPPGSPRRKSLENGNPRRKPAGALKRHRSTAPVTQRCCHKTAIPENRMCRTLRLPVRVGQISLTDQCRGHICPVLRRVSCHHRNGGQDIVVDHRSHRLIPIRAPGPDPNRSESWATSISTGPAPPSANCIQRVYVQFGAPSSTCRSTVPPDRTRKP